MLGEIITKIKLQGEQEEMKILNELRLKLENPNWALDPELALMDTILNVKVFSNFGDTPDSNPPSPPFSKGGME